MGYTKKCAKTVVIRLAVKRSEGVFNMQYAKRRDKRGYEWKAA